MLGLLKRYIEEGMEDETVELKESYHIGEATREMVAMANGGRRGYILFGVVEDANRPKRRGRTTWSRHNEFANCDDTERKLRQYVLDRVTPPPIFRVHSFKWTNGDTIGVVSVSASDKVHEFVRDVQDRGDKVIGRPGTFLIRDGVQVRPMTSDEVARAKQKGQTNQGVRVVDVINFGHALTDGQIEQLRRLGYVIGIPNLGERINLDDGKHFASQVERILDSFGYSKMEWEALGGQTLFVLPTLSDIAGVLLAQLHGRMGHFPRVIRRTRDEHGGFSVIEVIDLQSLRAQQRSKI